MIAIEIQVNGQLVATCGADAVRQLVAMVAARGLADSMSFDSGVTARIGISQPSSDEILKWVSNRIAIGDEGTLRVLEGTRAIRGCAGATDAAVRDRAVPRGRGGAAARPRPAACVARRAQAPDLAARGDARCRLDDRHARRPS